MILSGTSVLYIIDVIIYVVFSYLQGCRYVCIMLSFLFVLSVCLLMQIKSVHAKAVVQLLWAPTRQTWGHPDLGAFRSTALLWALCQGMHWNCYKQISFQHKKHALLACHQYIDHGISKKEGNGLGNRKSAWESNV